jgi:hypothetical protein
MNRIKKPRPPPINITNMYSEDIKDLLKNGTLDLEEFLKANNSNNTYVNNNENNDNNNFNNTAKDN